MEIVYLPEDSYWTPHKRSKYLIYDCVDEQSEYPSRKKNRDKINKLEIELLRKSDLIFVTGYELFKKKSIINVNTHFVSNGVDFDLFSHAQNTYTIEPEITELQGTIVLYIGAIFEWFDLDLVHYLAAERPHLNIVLIGPTNYDRLKLQKYKNILYIGKRKRELLPQYLKIAEVCIIPFVLNDLTHSVNPLKLYEYWAAGKPVVSVAMRELLPLKKDNILEIAETPQDFLAKLEKMIAANNESFEEIRRTIAKKYSWSLLFEKYSSIISQQLKSNNIL